MPCCASGPPVFPGGDEGAPHVTNRLLGRRSDSRSAQSSGLGGARADPARAHAGRTRSRSHVRTRAVYAAGMSDLTPDSPTAATTGRRDALAAWLDAQPSDLFADDEDLAALVAHHGLDARRPALHAAGRAVAGPLDAAARRNDLPGNHPVLEDWDGIGRYTAGVAHHPSHREAGTGDLRHRGDDRLRRGRGRRPGGRHLTAASDGPRATALHPLAVLPDRPGRRGRAQLPARLRRRGDPHPAAPGDRRAAGGLPPRAAGPGLRHEPHGLPVPDRGPGRLGRGRQRGGGHARGRPRRRPRLGVVDQRGEVVLLQHRRRRVPAHRARGRAAHGHQGPRACS